MQISENTAEALGEILDADVEMNYSRFGGAQECVAVITSQEGYELATTIREALQGFTEPDLFEALEYIADHESRRDARGFDTVYYWPGLTVQD